jgi:hypothetical protein
MAVIHLVHGFNISDGGETTVARLKPYLAESSQYTAQVFSYGWIGLMGAWFLNPRIVKQLMARVGASDIGCGHSNGCTLLHRASHLGAPFIGLIYINAALKSDAAGAPQVEWIDVYSNDGDHVVKFAALLRLLAPWAPLGDRLWGDMGTRGSTRSTSAAPYTPVGTLSYMIHRINMSALKWPWLLWLLRMIIGVPFSLLYMLFLAPFEVLLTVTHNNVRTQCTEMKVTISRPEDVRFIVVGFLVPTLFWTTVALWLA